MIDRYKIIARLLDFHNDIAKSMPDSIKYKIINKFIYM